MIPKMSLPRLSELNVITIQGDNCVGCDFFKSNRVVCEHVQCQELNPRLVFKVVQPLKKHLRGDWQETED